MMTHRERALAVLNYQSYDRLPIVHFGYWQETLDKWAAEGHLSEEEAAGASHIVGWGDINQFDRDISGKLGFDCDWMNLFPRAAAAALNFVPPFEESVVEQRPDGTTLVRNVDGVVVLRKPDIVSIPAEVDHLLKDRASWEEHYLPRLQFSPSRVDLDHLRRAVDASDEEGYPLGLQCGSLIGRIREWCGVVGLSYLIADDEKLVDEMIDTYADLQFAVAKAVLASGCRFDFGHFWEDIAFKNGPLINPALFERKLLPHYERFTQLLREHGTSVVSVDCDGMIDKLVPLWLRAGVNTMFPIEVGTWGASIRPWREKYGADLRGIGGMDKRVFALDRDAVDAEIQRLRPLVELGGYIPCPDHLVPPDAKWDNVKYYCHRMREVFG